MGATIFFMLIIVILRIRYRKMMREKNLDIFNHIKEEHRLAKELEHSKIEKETLEKILNDKIIIKLEIK